MRTLYYGVFADGAIVTYHGALAVFLDREEAEKVIAENKKIKRQIEVTFSIELVRVTRFDDK